MGGWIALPAADFTERLMWASFDAEVRRQILERGRWERPSAYDPEPYVITRRLIEDGRNHLVMDETIPFAGPVRIFQGGQDPDVPAAHAQALAALMQSPDLRFDLIEDGDHRLSRPQDIARLLATATELAERLSS